MSTDQIVLVGAARTPFARFDGALRNVSIPELGSSAVREALSRSRLSGADVDEVAIGVNFPGADRSLARQIQLRSEIPDDRNSFTVDRACCSSLAAVELACRGLRLGDVDVAVAGGAENLGRVPYYLDMRWGNRLGDVNLVDQLVISCPHTNVPRAVQAADEAIVFDVGRAEQDEWAVRSHERYGAALGSGYLVQEMFSVELATLDGDVARTESDDAYRPGANLDKLRSLPTVYGSATVTAGNAPGLSAGASAVVLTRDTIARERELDVMAEVVAMARASGPAEKIASMPSTAARRALATAEMTLDDVDLIEINEAFAAVPLVTTLALADGDRSCAEKLRQKTNVNGGAIAIGHPTGATATRMLMTAAFELRRRGGGIGLVTLCGGVGEAEAAVIRVAS